MFEYQSVCRALRESLPVCVCAPRLHTFLDRIDAVLCILHQVEVSQALCVAFQIEVKKCGGEMIQTVSQGDSARRKDVVGTVLKRAVRACFSCSDPKPSFDMLVI